MEKETTIWPELVYSVVTAATTFISVVCNKWYIALGVVIVFTLANVWRKHLDSKKPERVGNKPEDGKVQGEGEG